jgi:hypothetical protein
MNDERFDQLIAGHPATLEEFKELYLITVYDLQHAVRLRDEQAIETVTKAFDTWLREILNNVQTNHKEGMR